MIAKVSPLATLQRLRFRRVVLYTCECGRVVAKYHQRRGEEFIHADCYCGKSIDVQLVRNDYHENFRDRKGCRLTTPLHGGDLDFLTAEELLLR